MNHGSGSSQRRAGALLLPGEYGSGLTCEGCHTTEERDELTGSFDHLVGGDEEARRHVEAECFGHLLYRKIAGPFAF